MAGTGVGKFSSTAGSNTANMTVNFAENMAPSNVNNAARELMGHMRDMYEQLGDGYFEFGDGDGTYTVARGDADTITITSASDISSVYFAGRKIRITDGGANVVEGTIASSSHSSTTQTVNLTGISLASGTPTKVELGIDTAAFGGRVILDDDGDTYIEAPTDDTIDIYVAGAKDFVITANTFTAESGSTIAAQALTATTVTASGVVDITDTTDSTDATGDTGALRTEGGASIAKKLFVGTDLDVDGTANLDVVDIDGAVDMASTLQVDGSITSSDGATITTADNTNTLELISTDADASVGPNLLLYRNSSSPAVDDNTGKIAFQAENDADQVVEYFSIRTYIQDETDGTEDGHMQIVGVTNGADKKRLDLTATEAVFNDDSLDIDFRVESNGNAVMLVVDAGNDRIGVGTNVPDASLHVLSASAGSVSAASTEGLVVENSGNSSIHILAPDASDSRILFGSPSDNVNGFIKSNYDGNYLHMATGHGSGVIKIGSGSNGEHFRIIAGAASMGNEAAPDAGEGGMTFNQGSGDGNILTFKSSDVSVGTDEGEADTYASFKKQSASSGGLALTGIGSSSSLAMVLRASLDSASVNVTTSTSGYGVFATNCVKRDGSGNIGHLGADDNMCTFLNNDTTEVIFKGDGEIFSNQSATVGTFDTYEDAQLVRAYELSAGRYSKGLIDSKFDQFVQYNAKDLADANLIGKDEDGNANSFVNITGMQRLHNGAIWQQYEKHQNLAKAMYELAKVAVGEEKANEILEQNEIKLLN